MVYKTTNYSYKKFDKFGIKLLLFSIVLILKSQIDYFSSIS